MPDFRAFHLDITESTLEIDGEIRTMQFEYYGGEPTKQTKELSLYRPLSGITDHEWLKDVLVQVIEQL